MTTTTTCRVGDLVTFRDFGDNLVTGRVTYISEHKGKPAFDIETEDGSRWGYIHQIVKVQRAVAVTFGEYVTAYAADYPRHADTQRAGQYAFNLLCKVNLDLAEDVRGTLRDPFYRDDRLPEFFSYVAAIWDEA